MNLRKTNPLGLLLIEQRFKCIKNSFDEIVADSKVKTKINNQTTDEFLESNRGNDGLFIKTNLFDFNIKSNKTFRLSKNVLDACRFIDVDLIKENIEINEFNFESLTILLDNDVSGLIKVDRYGTDFNFLYLKDLKNELSTYFDTYSFLTKDFNFESSSKIEEQKFVIQVLAYLYYGDITTKFIPSKQEIKLSAFKKITNNSSFDICYVDTLWKQRISTDGFGVKGHFRLQPIGTERKQRKLIWIEQFQKQGYNRKATKELVA
jgi:hypothetical protein